MLTLFSVCVEHAASVVEVSGLPWLARSTILSSTAFFSFLCGRVNNPPHLIGRRNWGGPDDEVSAHLPQIISSSFSRGESLFPECGQGIRGCGVPLAPSDSSNTRRWSGDMTEESDDGLHHKRHQTMGL